MSITSMPFELFDADAFLDEAMATPAIIPGPGSLLDDELQRFCQERLEPIGEKQTGLVTKIAALTGKLLLLEVHHFAASCRTIARTWLQDGPDKPLFSKSCMGPLLQLKEYFTRRFQIHLLQNLRFIRDNGDILLTGNSKLTLDVVAAEADLWERAASIGLMDDSTYIRTLLSLNQMDSDADFLEITTVLEHDKLQDEYDQQLDECMQALAAQKEADATDQSNRLHQALPVDPPSA
jgi:hypothetical protein